MDGLAVRLFRRRRREREQHRAIRREIRGVEHDVESLAARLAEVELRVGIHRPPVEVKP